MNNDLNNLSNSSKHDLDSIRANAFNPAKQTEDYQKLLEKEYEEKEEHKSSISFLKDIYLWIMDSVQVVILVLATIIVSYLFIISPHTVEGPSMQPNICQGDIIIAEKFTPRFSGYKRGDVIIFRHDEANDYVKRIIGIGGDRVKVLDGKVYVNGVLLEEKYLPSGRRTDLSGEDGLKEGQEYTVPTGQYLVFGDNRPQSLDSRRFLAIDPAVNIIKGKVVYVVWPVQRNRVFDDYDQRPVNECRNT